MQSYTEEFRMITLIFSVDLSSQDTLLKHIGGFHSYLIHTILMFNPKILDEFCVHATHLETRGKNFSNGKSENTFGSGDKGKDKLKGKGNNNVSINMEK